MYDLIIKNGIIIDGTGSPSFHADVAIKDGKIARIARNLTGSQQEIDATGLTVTPGFIDSHSHSDASLLSFPEQIEKAEQGITTSLGGMCGDSPAPLPKGAKAVEVGSFGLSTEVYKTMGTFLDTVKHVPLGSNHACFVGHSSLREAVMNRENREPTPEELEQMADYLRDGMEHGARGLSLGLIYTPGSFAKTDEVVYLAKIVAQYGGVVSAHIRDEGYQLVKAVEEFIDIIKVSGAKGVISHHKTMYRDNWGKIHTTLRMIDQANAEGCDIYCDVYPYIASHTSLYARFIPKEYCAGGNDALVERLKDPAVREKIRALNIEKFGPKDDLSWGLVARCGAPGYAGLRLNEIAQKQGKDVYDVIFDIIIESRNNCGVCFFLMCEEDVETVMAHPRCMICTDSGVRGKSSYTHPRLRGSFTRTLGRYVRERKVVSLPEMIRKMTAMPASVYDLQGKGLLREGFDADICIFDADKIIDRCDFTNCHERAEGLNYVLVGGKVTVENAVYNGTRAGKLIY